jgi:homoserine O-succinyltransferase
MLTINSESSATGFGDAHDLVIGLVNNMPDGALHSTERQFRELLVTAAQGFGVSLRFFSLPGISRAPSARLYVSECYEDVGQLWSTCLDGLIVTGTEPRATSLADEPYWAAFKELIDKAQEHAIPTVWSCLAAHAAVLHLDGVQRRRFGEKLSGVFECTKMAEHEIVADAPSRWHVPHSRHNDLPEQQLVSKGYRILSGSPDVGADMFIREGRSLFIFLQGHPEYDSEALFREYRRDVRRFLAGERDDYPTMPRAYFDRETEAAYAAFQERAMKNRSTDVLQYFPQGSVKFVVAWHESAVWLYGNWLSYLAGRRNRCRHLPASQGGISGPSPERNEGVSGTEAARLRILQNPSA